MTSSPDSPRLENQAVWEDVLQHGHVGRWSFLPANPRCIMCRQPFRGVGGALLRFFTGYGPSRNSPNFCNFCEVALPSGGAEVDVAVLFADIRGSTALAERMTAGEYAGLLNRFYHATSDVLVAEEGWIDKLVGDEIMALYIPAMGSDYRQRAVATGVSLLEAVGYGSSAGAWLPVAVGVHAGPAFVGKFGKDGANQVTALGDTVNTAARIQAAAAPGEVLVSAELFSSVAGQFASNGERTLTLRGKDEPVQVHVLRPAAVAAV